MMIITPKFKHSELSYASNKSSTEVILHELESLIHSVNCVYTPDEDVIFVITRQKKDDEFIYTMTGSSLTHGDVYINFSDSEGIPQIFLNIKRDIINILKRITDNLIFS